METGFTVIRMQISIFIILNILAPAVPKIWEEIGIDGWHDAYFGIWGRKLRCF
jgi:hypothetical protein